jgi:hypothetical protein
MDINIFNQLIKYLNLYANIILITMRRSVSGYHMTRSSFRAAARNVHPRAGHSSGKIHYALSQGPLLEKDHILNWALNTEHGLLHGFLVGFWSLVLKDKFVSNELADCFMHDFLRCGKAEEPHDELISYYFPELKESIHHSNPTNGDSLIVLGDRIELYRYEDSNDWVKSEILNQYIDSDLKKELVATFYKHIRPILVELFVGRYDLWITHGIEHGTEYGTEHKFQYGTNDTYPKYYWSPKEDYWCCDVQKIPFYRYFIIKNTPIGIIRAKTLSSYNGVIIPTKDHHATNAKIPLKEWGFLTTSPIQTIGALSKSKGVIDLHLINKIMYGTEMVINSITATRTKPC